jgi:hypothetical protein
MNLHCGENLNSYIKVILWHAIIYQQKTETAFEMLTLQFFQKADVR